MSDEPTNEGEKSRLAPVERLVRASMVKVRMFKMTHKNTHFNKNQKVWIIFNSGNCAAECSGKFRGKGRYVSAWVTWRDKNHPAPEFIEVEVPETFATTHCLGVVQP